MPTFRVGYRATDIREVMVEAETIKEASRMVQSGEVPYEESSLIDCEDIEIVWWQEEK